ncbi:MAG: hypothetical protein RR512_04870 [Coprobacillus sp.]
MRKDYKSVNDLSLSSKKAYLLKVCKNIEVKEKLYDCMNEKAFLCLLEQYNDLFYNEALKTLYRSTNYEVLEYNLIMMNSLFKQTSFLDIKKELLQKLCKKSITINEYCVIRQLVDFKAITFSSFIESLNIKYEVDDEECARICLLEDQYHLACQYLKRLNDCKDEYLLDLLSSFSIYEYASLMRHYAKKKSRYLLIPSH